MSSLRSLPLASLLLCSGSLALACSPATTPRATTPPASNPSDQPGPPQQDADPIPQPGPSPLASVAPTDNGWFDPTPLLSSLRPAERVDTAQRAGLPSLDTIALYDLAVSIDPEAGAFDLQQETYFTNTYDETLPNLVFRLYGNPSSSGAPSRIRMLKGSCHQRTCTVRQNPASVITVSFGKPLAPGERVRVRFDVAGVLDRVEPAEVGLIAQSLGGMLAMNDPSGHNDYGLLSVCDGFVSMAGFFPVIGRRQGGRWAPPESSSIGDMGSEDLAHVRAQIHVPPLVQVMSPGSAVRSVLVPGTGGEDIRRRFDIAAAMVRDFALFAGEKVGVRERKVGDVTVRSTYMEGNGAVGDRVADVAQRSLEIFERRFGPYPYTELDVVEAPLTGGAGGVEFSGLVTAASMLYRPFPKDDPLAALLGMLGGGGSGSPAMSMLDETLEFTVAHEVSHQWWYGLVGSDSRAHPFVDESLAQYSTLVYFEDRYGANRARRVADTQVRMNYVGMRMMGQPDAPADRPVSSFSPIGYAGLVYGKAPFFYRETRKAVGDAEFFAALRRYADQHRFRSSQGRGPLPQLASGAHQAAVEALAQRWLEQTHGDKDLGPIDMRSMLNVLLGPDADKIAPQAEEMLRLLGPSGSGGANAPSAPGAPRDPTKVLEQLQQLERMLESF